MLVSNGGGVQEKAELTINTKKHWKKDIFAFRCQKTKTKPLRKALILHGEKRTYLEAWYKLLTKLSDRCLVHYVPSF